MKRSIIRLVREELRSFLSLRYFACLAVGIAGMLLSFLYYEHQYQGYPQQRKKELLEEGAKLGEWAFSLNERVQQLKESDPDYEWMDGAETAAKVFSDYTARINVLANMWELMPDSVDMLFAAEQVKDSLLEPLSGEAVKMDMDYCQTGIYGNTIEDWQMRKVIREEYAGIGAIELAIYPLIPDGTYLLADTWGYLGPAMIEILLLVTVLLFDMWSGEFETEAYRLYFVNPYSRRTLYLTRVAVRSAATLLLVFILFAVLYGIGYIRYGSGSERLSAIYQDGVMAAVPTRQLLRQEFIILLLYLLGFMLLLTLVSFLLKSRITTFTVFLAGILLLLSNSDGGAGLSDWNPLCYIYGGRLIQENAGFRFLAAAGLLAVCDAAVGLAGVWAVQKSDLHS